MSQLKRQDKTPGKKKKTGFRIMIVKIIQDLRKTMEKMQEMFTKDLEKLKNK